MPDHDPSLTSSAITGQGFHHQLDQKSSYTPFGVIFRDTKGGSHLPQSAPLIVQGLLSAGHCPCPNPLWRLQGGAQPLPMPRCLRALAGLGCSQPRASPALPAKIHCSSSMSHHQPLCPGPLTPSEQCASALGTSHSSVQGHHVPLPKLGAAAWLFHLSALLYIPCKFLESPPKITASTSVLTSSPSGCSCPVTSCSPVSHHGLAVTGQAQLPQPGEPG